MTTIPRPLAHLFAALITAAARLGEATVMRAGEFAEDDDA